MFIESDNHKDYFSSLKLCMSWTKMSHKTDILWEFYCADKCIFMLHFKLHQPMKKSIKRLNAQKTKSSRLGCNFAFFFNNSELKE